MRAVDIIEKKKRGEENTYEELKFLTDGYLDGTVEDYQMSAWLMAVCLKGLNFEETVNLTDIFVKSGDILSYEDIEGHIADKHSTGGVGDKVTLILIPILASVGVKCAKLSGRGLGMTGGTIDKLESIPGFSTMLNEDEFKKQIKEIGAAISSQTPNLVPADGKIYSLRDVTATVDNKSLICASVVSKKIASGADVVVLDVKYGAGAFIKTKEEARELADLMIQVGLKLGRKFDAVISSMEQPLGTSVGNALEVIEAIDFLDGRLTYDLYEIVLELAAKTIVLCELAPDFKAAKKLVDKAILSKRGLKKFREIVAAQRGNVCVFDNHALMPYGENYIEIHAQSDMGYVKTLDAMKVALACKLLGAGRDKKSDSIDFGAGCVLKKRMGDIVKENDILATIYYNDISEEKLNTAVKSLTEAYCFTDEKVQKTSIIVR